MLSEPGWAGLEDGLGWVVLWGYCGDGGGFVVVRSAPFGLPVALILALSRRAGEGIVVVGEDCSAIAVLLDV